MVGSAELGSCSKVSFYNAEQYSISTTQHCMAITNPYNGKVPYWRTIVVI